MIFEIPSEKYKKANTYEKRDCFTQLIQYLKSDNTNVCSIYGLRRTGKSTMMYQAIEEVGLNRCGYILCEDKDTYGELCQNIEKYIEEGKAAIFIDEVTKISNFVTSSASLADYYAGKGSKIVITGTDSLGLSLATRGELYDRTDDIHTTYISYGEFVRLIKNTDIDDFIHFAGVLSHEENIKERPFFDRKTASHYIDTAISNNITNTFFNKKLPPSFIHRYDKLIGMHNRNTLIPVITAIVEMYSGVITKNTIDAYINQEKYSNADISSAIDLLAKNGVFLDRIEYSDNLDSQIVFAINSRQDIKGEINEEEVSQIKEYLSDLELLVKIPLIRHNANNPKREYTYETDEYIYQAGMKYCQAKAIIDVIKESNELNLSPIEKETLCKKIEEDVKGQILEVTTFNDLQMLLDMGRYDVFKMQFVGDKDGEIDIVIYDKKEKSCFGFEIKHSSQKHEEQLKNLLHKPFQKVLESNFGKIKGLYVLYRGDTEHLDNGVDYINVGSFLSNLYLIKEKSIENTINSCFIECKKKLQFTKDSLKNDLAEKNAADRDDAVKPGNKKNINQSL